SLPDAAYCAREKGKMPERANQSPRETVALPQFCTWAAVFALIVVAELVVVIAALVPDSGMSFRAFSMASAFAVWLALLCAALLRYFYVLAEWRARLAAVARAQFEALQARIRPHFLFNSMNTVAAL